MHLAFVNSICICPNELDIPTCSYPKWVRCMSNVWGVPIGPNEARSLKQWRPQQVGAHLKLPRAQAEATFRNRRCQLDPTCCGDWSRSCTWVGLMATKDWYKEKTEKKTWDEAGKIVIQPTFKGMTGYQFLQPSTSVTTNGSIDPSTGIIQEDAR